MDLLPFKALPAYKSRQFVPQEVDLGDWEQMAPLFDQLEQAATQATNAAELERWLLDWSELSAALDEESSKRYIAMTCHTDNAEAEKAYLHFVEQIEPQTQAAPVQAGADLRHPSAAAQVAPSSATRFSTATRKVHVELFRPENVPLETEEAKLSQQYQKLSGSLTVQFRGEEKTLVQMGRYLEEPDRALRQEAWELVANRRLQEAEKFEEIFDQPRSSCASRSRGMPGSITTAITPSAGWAGSITRRPIASAFHEAVETEIMPVVRELQAERRRQLGLETLRPWDLAVDPLNRPPLRPFEQVDQMVVAHAGDFRPARRRAGRRAFSRCRTCVCSTSPIARARRRAATSPRSPRRGCRSSS